MFHLVKGEQTEVVKVMKYLGVLFNLDGSCEDEVESRTEAACRTIGPLRKKIVVVRS